MDMDKTTNQSLGERLDADGYLRNHTEWTTIIAEQLAAQEQITLTNEHWRLIDLLRNYYARTDTAPAMRPLVKLVKAELGEHMGSAQLMHLFGGSPAKMLAKLAGLPRPTNCI
tara:strand:- start:798 stop:1136 length:339 start_codon:yes stop_codon:yes gene_type:complete